MLYFARGGDLPWMEAERIQDDKKFEKRMLEMKQQTPLTELCQD